MKTLARHVPLLMWLPSYDRRWLRRDVLAGLTVWALAVPESMAYAGIAGVPVQYGLYAIPLFLLGYVLFGSCRQLFDCCDHFVEPEYRLGNIHETHMRELVGSDRQRQFGLDIARHAPASLPSATCASPATAAAPRTASSRHPTAEPGLNYLCAGYKDFFHHVDGAMRLMADRLRHDRAPAEIMSLYAADDAHRGRNDPCTCGSGRKWKHCHGA